MKHFEEKTVMTNDIYPVSPQVICALKLSRKQSQPVFKHAMSKYNQLKKIR